MVWNIDYSGDPGITLAHPSSGSNQPIYCVARQDLLDRQVIEETKCRHEALLIVVRHAKRTVVGKRVLPRNR